MIKLYDIDHVKFGVHDLDASQHAWEVEFGLHATEKNPNEVKLAVNYEPHSIIIEKSNDHGIQYTAYNLHPDFSPTMPRSI